MEELCRELYNGCFIVKDVTFRCKRLAHPLVLQDMINEIWAEHGAMEHLYFCLPGRISSCN